MSDLLDRITALEEERQALLADKGKYATATKRQRLCELNEALNPDGLLWRARRAEMHGCEEMAAPVSGRTQARLQNWLKRQHN